MSLTHPEITTLLAEALGAELCLDPPDDPPFATSRLEAAGTPAQLRALPESDLPALASELRRYLLHSVARSGGHLAAGLGVVELTVALHYVFDTPADTLVWDVGHQGYPHKVLTGRRATLPAIRRRGGPSGFLRRSESPYDAFGAGHSSTSISAALGIALAERAQGRRSKTVAVIGDGALTAGIAFEALGHAGVSGADLLIVLNDNGMSISPNVGGLSRYLARLADGAGDRGALFEDLGVAYLGPCRGDDLPAVLAALRRARGLPGPRLLHVLTRKGAGYPPAVADPVKYHGVTPFDPEMGIRPPAAEAPPARTYTDVFADWLCEAAASDERLVGITPAMREGSGLVKFAQRFPRRYFDVAIAEQHAVTLAAGLASRGMKPVVAIYSTFLQRGYDQLIHDVAIQNLPVLFAIDRAGLVGPDGATHCGSFDLSYLRCIPGLTVMVPADGAELRDMLHTGSGIDGPVAVRYPRAAVPDPAGATGAAPGNRAPAARAARSLPLGVAERRREGRRIALLVFGTLLRPALEVGERLDATVVSMRFVKPLDRGLLRELAAQHELLVTLEENAVAGGAGSAVNEALAADGLAVPVLNLGLPDRFIEHGTRDECLRDAGLDRDGILAAIEGRTGGSVKHS